MQWLLDTTSTSSSRSFDLIAAGICGVLVAGAGAASSRRPRSAARCARSPTTTRRRWRSAFRCSTSGRIVWAVAGFVALVAGLLWGARNGVQFALTFVALKALPVLILGGFTSVPGAIVGGLIIGASEKLAEVYLGPMVGGGIEGWFPYVLALLFLLVRPEGLFGETHHPEDLTMFYREAGQFKTTYAADSQHLPDPPGPHRACCCCCAGRLRRGAAGGVALPVLGDPDPVPDLFAGGAGPEHPDRLRRPAVAGLGRLHGGRRVRVLQLHAAHSRHAAAAGLRAGRPVRGAGGHRVRPAVAAHPRLLPGRRHAGDAVLRGLVPDQDSVAHQLQHAPA